VEKRIGKNLRLSREITKEEGRKGRTGITRKKGGSRWYLYVKVGRGNAKKARSALGGEIQTQANLSSAFYALGGTAVGVFRMKEETEASENERKKRRGRGKFPSKKKKVKGNEGGPPFRLTGKESWLKRRKTGGTTRARSDNHVSIIGDQRRQKKWAREFKARGGRRKKNRLGGSRAFHSRLNENYLSDLAERWCRRRDLKNKQGGIKEEGGLETEGQREKDSNLHSQGTPPIRTDTKNKGGGREQPRS